MYSSTYTKQDEEGYLFWSDFCEKTGTQLIGWTYKQRATICRIGEFPLSVEVPGWFAEQIMNKIKARS